MAKGREKLIVAVSGGVDSVVLLDQLIKQQEYDLVVAHFDHGIRKNSHLDAKFVEDLARQHGLGFEMSREELGPDAGEAIARKRRYKFLREIAKKYQAKLATAHHMNDVAETVAINLFRGTGWRGLAVMDGDIFRPLLHIAKREIIEYAKENQLNWVEDETNKSERYLRNRLRARLQDNELVEELHELRSRQIELKRQIEKEIEDLKLNSPYSREFFSALDTCVARECLRSITNSRLTRPQMDRALEAIKTFKSGKIIEAGNKINLVFTTRYFTVEML